MVDFASLVSLLGNRALFTLTITGAPVELRVGRFIGSEALSGGFEFRLELAGPEVELASIVGKDALLTIESIDTPHHVHGILAELEYVGDSRQHCLHTALLVPRAWKLRHRTNSRIFQRKTTESIVQEVLTKAGMTGNQYRFSLTGSYSPRDYARGGDWSETAAADLPEFMAVENGRLKGLTAYFIGARCAVAAEP